jgi:uroporphyrinogen decarboxylase
VDIINCGPAADIAAVRTALTGKTCFSGNLDPIEVLMRGTPQQVAAEARRIVRTCYDQGGYLFCTGEMTPRDVPFDNMKAMIRAARQAAEEL